MRGGRLLGQLLSVLTLMPYDLWLCCIFADLIILQLTLFNTRRRARSEEHENEGLEKKGGGGGGIVVPTLALPIM